MGNYGSVIAFAPVSVPPKDGPVKQICADLLQIFVTERVLPQGAAETAEYSSDPNNGDITRNFYDDLSDREHFELCIGRNTAPLTPRIEELVYAYPLKTNGFWVAHLTKSKYEDVHVHDIGNMTLRYRFPQVYAYAFNRKVTITDTVTGESVATTWSLVQFALEGCRFDKRTHFIPFPNHPVFQMLKEYWGGLDWSAVC